MSEYRLYCLNDDGRFTKSHEIEAKGDADALAKARSMKLPVICELWNRNRLVATVPAHQQEAP